jgi:hypothetical protein
MKTEFVNVAERYNAKKRLEETEEQMKVRPQQTREATRKRRK